MNIQTVRVGDVYQMTNQLYYLLMLKIVDGRMLFGELLKRHEMWGLHGHFSEHWTGTLHGLMLVPQADHFIVRGVEIWLERAAQQKLHTHFYFTAENLTFLTYVEHLEPASQLAVALWGEAFAYDADEEAGIKNIEHAAQK